MLKMPEPIFKALFDCLKIGIFLDGKFVNIIVLLVGAESYEEITEGWIADISCVDCQAEKLKKRTIFLLKFGQFTGNFFRIDAEKINFEPFDLYIGLD